MPRRYTGSGPAMAGGGSENLRIKFNGEAVLVGKNEADNPILDQFTQTGELEGWVLDHPPEQTAIGVYAEGPGITMSRQAIIDLSTDPYHDQKDPLIQDHSPPDQTTQAAIAPYLLPPLLELVPSAGGVGYPQGWWAFVYAFGIGKKGKKGKGGLRTNCGPVFALFLNNGEGARIPLDGITVPEGVTFISIGMMGPFASENLALNTNVIYEQKVESTYPRVPATTDLVGGFKTGRRLSFVINETFLGTSGRKPKHKKKKHPGQPHKRKKKRGN